MIRTSRAAWVLATTFLLVGAPRPARAQFFADPSAQGAGNIEGFTVAGKGSVSARPNRLEIDLEVSAASELTADAIVKYRDAKRRLQEAFAALKLPDVAVEERGLLVDEKGSQMSPYFFDYTPSKKGKTEVQLTRRLVVTCGAIRKLDEEALLQLVAKLLDVAQDAGGKVGPGTDDMSPYFSRWNRRSTGLVRFILDDYDKLEEEAYAKAIADAESRARRLAKLGRVKLGPVTSLRETSTPGRKVASMYDDGSATHDDEPAHRRLESSRFQEIPVKVELLVRFNVAPAGAGGQPDGRAGDR